MTDHDTDSDSADTDYGLEGDDYEVGYRRPPRRNRFKPGQSGNPDGRPPKESADVNLKDLLEQMLSEKVPIRKGGKTRHISALEAVFLSLRNKTIQGNQSAIKTLLSLMKETGTYFAKENTGGGGILVVPPNVTSEEFLRIVKRHNDEKAAKKERARSKKRKI